MSKTEKLQVDLLATDKASKVVGELASQVDALDGSSAEVALDADDNASATIEEVDSAVAALEGTEAEVTLTAEDKATDEVKTLEERIETLTDDEKAVILNAKIAAAEADIKKINTLLASTDGDDAEVLLTAKDEASARLDALRTKVATLDTNMRQVDDQSRSVGANFAGNMITELPGLSGAFGPLNMAIGQFAEYASEGNINLRNFLKTAAPIAGLTAGFFAVRNAISYINQDAEKAEDRLQQFKDALEETGDVVAAVKQIVEADGGIFAPDDESFGDAMLDGFLGIQDAANNLVPILDAAGISVNDWARAVGDASDSGGMDALMSDLQTAVETGQITEDQWRELVKQAYADQTAAMEAAEQSGQMRRLLAEKAEAMQESGDAYLDLRAAEREAADSLDEYHVLMAGEVTPSLREQEEALDDVVRSYDDAADATVASARNSATARGATLSEAEALRTKTNALLADAAAMEGPEKAAILGHILRINGIPEERITTIFTDNDPNDLAQVEAELATASRARDALIQARIDQAAAAYARTQLQLLTAPRSQLITPIYTSPGGQRYSAGATGIPSTPGSRDILVGEEGPEILRTPAGSEIVNARRTGELARAGDGNASTSITNNIVMNLPAGSNSNDVVNATRRYTRLQGGM